MGRFPDSQSLASAHSGMLTRSFYAVSYTHLMWLVRGYIHYKERGLAMSGSLKSVVTKYERDNDLVLQMCIRDSPGGN